jgi:hypothetical protein
VAIGRVGGVPIWPPKPIPAVTRAEGADQPGERLGRIHGWGGRTAIGETSYDETGANSTGEEEASLKDQINGLYRMQYLENGDDGKALCIGEDRGRDDFVRAKGLSRINKAAHTESDTMHTGRGDIRGKNSTDFPRDIALAQ